MKLRNKKTGEIGYPYFQNWKEKSCVIVDENAIQIAEYTSLAELNAEWEDVPEELKDFWYISDFGDILNHVISNKSVQLTIEEMKSIGNYFDTREEAEKAVEKLKAWKRLKDKGFRFEYYDYSDRDLHNHIQIKALTNREVEDSMLYMKDLDLLFGGEE